MLIKCPECGHDVSDKASICPNCAFPISDMANSSPEAKKPRKKANTQSNKYRRLPNGYGCINKLSGKRRKPFAAYPPTTGYKENGSPIRPSAIGYYETYQEAYSALMDYKRDPEKESSKSITFAQVYERWWKYKFDDPKSKVELSESTKRNYKWGYGKCKSLYDIPMSEIGMDKLQAIIDGLNKSFSSARNLHNLFSSMWDYAYKNGIVDKDYSKFVVIKQQREFEKGVPFTSEEINTLWKNVKNTNVQIILILIYTGYRISELKSCTIDLENKQFIGGMKTDAGKNRIVPMHSKIVPLVEQFDQASWSKSNFQDKLFRKTLTMLGFADASTGERHTPHDCRHTFSWLADKYGMEDVAKRMIMGHSLGKDVEKLHYTHRTADQLRAEMEKIAE